MRQQRLLLALLLFLLGIGAVVAEERTWTSAKGGKTIQGSLVDAEGENVTIRRKDGKEFTVPIKIFVEEDQQYVLDMLAAENAEAEVEIKAKRFYQLVRTNDPLSLEEVLTKAAATTLESNTSFFEGITPPDRGTSARVKRVSIEDDVALAEMSVKISGQYRSITVNLLREGESWGVAGLTYENENEEKQRMDFVAGNTVDGSVPVDATEPDGVFGRPSSELAPLAGRRPPQTASSPRGGVPIPDRSPAAPGFDPREPIRAPAAGRPPGPPPHAEPPSTPIAATAQGSSAPLTPVGTRGAHGAANDPQGAHGPQDTPGSRGAHGPQDTPGSRGAHGPSKGAPIE